jgi:hypothetical protein
MFGTKSSLEKVYPLLNSLVHATFYSYTILVSLYLGQQTGFNTDIDASINSKLFHQYRWIMIAYFCLETIKLLRKRERSLLDKQLIAHHLTYATGVLTNVQTGVADSYPVNMGLVELSSIPMMLYQYSKGKGTLACFWVSFFATRIVWATYVNLVGGYQLFWGHYHPVVYLIYGWNGIYTIAQNFWWFKGLNRQLLRQLRADEPTKKLND